MHCAICYHLHNFKNVGNTHRGVLLLVKLHASACNFTKSNTPPWVFFTYFLNCTNGTKSRSTSQSIGDHGDRLANLSSLTVVILSATARKSDKGNFYCLNKS